MRLSVIIATFFFLVVQLYSYSISTGKIDLQKPEFLNVDYKRTKTFSKPNEKLSKWIYFKDSNKLNKFYGSLLIKSKGEKGIAYYLIRVWDGKKYYFKRVRRSKIKPGDILFSMKTNNGLEYTVKCPKKSYTKKTLNASIKGKVKSPDFT